ncbi:MAG: hypothetical protein JKY42_08165, partial [Flavobacteriales bacterium]|nr:hypothetical protein [Flavobacteriales bacterium]
MEITKCILFSLAIPFSFLLICNTAVAQYVPNGSFEGRIGMERIPDGWVPCDWLSTPDTHPASRFNVDQEASDGETYLGLVTRGGLGPYKHTYETIGCQLLDALLIDSCYTLSLDLALCYNCGRTINDDEWLSYWNPVILKIYGGYKTCPVEELIYTSKPIEHTDWLTYGTSFSPEITNYSHIRIEAHFVGDDTYLGNILIDNLTISDTPQDFFSYETTVTPGVDFELEASSGVDYNWSPDESLSCNNCQFPTATVDKFTLFSVDITDESGC